MAILVSWLLLGKTFRYLAQGGNLCLECNNIFPGHMGEFDLLENPGNRVNSESNQEKYYFLATVKSFSLLSPAKPSEIIAG